MLLVRRKLSVIHWPSLELHIMETERRAWSHPPVKYLNNRSLVLVHWTEPQRSALGLANLVAQYFLKTWTTDYCRFNPFHYDLTSLDKYKMQLLSIALLYSIILSGSLRHIWP